MPFMLPKELVPGFSTSVKPTIPVVIDPTSPYAPSNFWLLNQQSTQDLVTGIPLTHVGDREFVRGNLSYSSAANLNHAYSQLIPSNNTAFDFVLQVKFTMLDAYDHSTLFSWGNTDSDAAPFAFAKFDSLGQLSVYFDGSYLYNGTTDLTGEEITLTCAGYSSGWIYIYLNGEEVYSADRGTWTDSNASDRFYINNGYYNTDVLTIHFEHLYYKAGFIPLESLHEIISSPYQVLKPEISNPAHLVPYVNPLIEVDTDGGGDYSSLNSALSNLPNPLTQDTTITCTGSIADSAVATVPNQLGGYTLTIEAAAGDEAGTSWDSSKYRLEGDGLGGNGQLYINQAPNVVVKNLQISMTDTSTTREALRAYVAPAGVVVDSCYVRSSGGTAIENILTVRNTIVDGGSTGILCYYAATYSLENNTIVNVTTGIDGGVNLRTVGIENNYVDATTAYANTTNFTLTTCMHSTSQVITGSTADVLFSDDNFEDVSTPDIAITIDSQLQGTGTDIGLTYDTDEKYYPSFSTTYYVPVGASAGVAEFRALRLNSTIFDAMTALEKARYNGLFYSTIATWEATLTSTDLVADNKKYVLEMFNDSAAGYASNLATIDSIPSDPTHNIIIRSAPGSGDYGDNFHDGKIGTGVFLTSVGAWSTILVINCEYTELFGFALENINDHLNCSAIEIGAENVVVRDNVFEGWTIGVLLNSGVSQIADTGITFHHNLLLNITTTALDGYYNRPFLAYNNSIIDCTSAFDLATGFFSTINNNVMVGCTTDCSTNYTAASTNNATDKTVAASGLTTGDNNLFEITTAEFVDPANDDYNLAYDSQLHGTGTDVDVAYDIIGKTYHSYLTTNYVPIGAYRGLSEFAAIRVNTATFEAMTNHQRARYNDTFYTLFATFESNLPADLTTVNEQHVAEGYDDWATYPDNLSTIGYTPSSVANGVVLRGADIDGTQGSSRCNGTFTEGFMLSNQYTASIYLGNFILDGIRCQNTQESFISTEVSLSTTTDDIIRFKNCTFHEVGDDNGRFFRQDVGINHRSSFELINCIVKGYIELRNTSSTNIHKIYNNTFLDTTTVNALQFSTYGAEARTDSKNNVFFNNTNDSDDQPAIGNSNNATSNSTVGNIGADAITDIVSGDFIDTANDDYNLSYDSQLHGAGTDVGITLDIIGKTYHSYSTTNYVPIGAFRGLSEFSALRVDLATFEAMTDLERARYNDTFYSLLSTWETDVPANLTTNNEQHVLECYNDWASGLSDLVLIDDRTTSTDNNIIITSPDGERHTGVIESGFFMASGSYSVRMISAEPSYTVIEYLELYCNYGNNGNLEVSGTTYTNVHHNIIRRLANNNYGIYTEAVGDVTNNLIINCDNGINANYYKSTIQNNTIIDCTDGVYGHPTGAAHLLNNNVFYNCIVNDVTANTIDVNSGNNATSLSSAASSLVDADGNIFDITDSEFVDLDNDNYNLSYDSQLHGAGEDVGITHDILDKPYHSYSTTNYVPIGAFRGLSEFSALRVDLATFQAMTDLERSRYNDTFYTLLSTWETDIPADLTAVNEQWVAECYDDWVGGLDDSVVIADRTTDSTRNILLTVADGEQHNGVDYSTGFYIETDARTVIRFLPDYTVIDGMAINIIYSSYGPAGIRTAEDNSISPIIRNNLIHSQFDAVGNPISIYVATSDYAAIYNNVVIDHSTTPAGLGFYVDCYSADVYSNTAVNLDRGLSVYGGSIVNNISYGCTTDYEFSGFNPNSATNASDKSTATDASVTVLNLTDSDFRDVSNNDYRISFDSDLVDAGTDLSADFTTDIVGTERS